MASKFRAIVVFLVVAMAAARGGYFCLDLALFYLDHESNPIEVGADQLALHAILKGQKAALLVTDFDGHDEQSRAYSGQLASLPVPLLFLNGRNDHEIENYLRADVAVVLDSMSLERQEEILAQLRTTDVVFHEEQVGKNYLVLFPGSRS